MRIRFAASTTIVVTALLSIGATLAEAQTPVTSCGQTLINEDGVLTADLECQAPSTFSSAVQLYNATLNLGGFTLTMPPDEGIGVLCGARCAVVGPGTIVGGGMGIKGPYRGRVLVDGVTVTGVGFIAIGGTAVRVTDSTLIDNGSSGVSGNRIRIEGSTVTGNNQIDESRAAVSGWIKAVRVTDTIITGNHFSGVYAHRVRADNSTISGNGLNASCGVTQICSDVVTHGKPRLSATTCDTSAELGHCSESGGPCTHLGDPLTPDNDPVAHNWSICSLD
jgi:hypothetical protein